MSGTNIALISIILTIVFGIPSYFFLFRRSKNLVSLEFEKFSCYSLFRSTDINRLNIELKYNKKLIKNRIVLLVASISNNGQLDIDKNRIFSPLRITTNKNFKWLDATTVYFYSKNSKRSKTNCKIIDDQSIEIDWDLLKKGENILIEGLAEVKDSGHRFDFKDDDFFDSLIFDHRITDLKSVKKIKNEESNTSIIYKANRLLFKHVGKFFLVAVLGGIIILTLDLVPEFNKYIYSTTMEYVISDGVEEKTVYISQGSDTDKLQVKYKDSDDILRIPFSEFYEKYTIKNVKEKPISTFSRIFSKIAGSLYIITGILGLFFSRKQRRKFTVPKF